jgi:hypothetical protein
MQTLALALVLLAPAALDDPPDDPAGASPEPMVAPSEVPTELTTEIKATATTRARASAVSFEREEPRPVVKKAARDSNPWSEGGTFFGGGRAAVAFPPAADGPAPMAGIELGVAAQKGFGFGLHLFGAMNTPGAPEFGLPKTPYGFGAEVDLRYYLQTIEPLRLYPTLSVGFMAGPAADTGKNAVLPLVTPGFGARVNLGPVYTALEIGAADFYIPFMAVAVGWEPDRA